MICSLTNPSLWLVAGSVAVGVFFFMSLWYGISQYFKRLDIVDSAWGLGFIYVAVLGILLQPYLELIHYLTLGFVATWGLRLTIHITSRNIGKPEDGRYVALREKWGSRAAVKSFFNIFMLQGLLIVLISAPVIAIMSTSPARINALAIVGFVVWGFGIIFESVGDYQLRKFIKTKKKGEVIQSGLWKYSRHPNYFGEITAWWGAGIVAASLGAWWSLLGSALITFFIVKISGVPLLEKKYATNKQFQAYKKRTSILIPLPPKK